MAELGRAAGYSKSTVKNALDKRYMEGMQIIADALGRLAISLSRFIKRRTLSIPNLKVHRGFPGKAAFIFKKK